jgi:hypothetical protein
MWRLVLSLCHARHDQRLERGLRAVQQLDAGNYRSDQPLVGSHRFTKSNNIPIDEESGGLWLDLIGLRLVSLTNMSSVVRVEVYEISL